MLDRKLAQNIYLEGAEYKGYFDGKTYYIHKTKQGYTASTGGIYCTKFDARTLKELSNILSEVKQ